MGSLVKHDSIILYVYCCVQIWNTSDIIAITEKWFRGYGAGVIEKTYAAARGVSAVGAGAALAAAAAARAAAP